MISFLDAKRNINKSGVIFYTSNVANHRQNKVAERSSTYLLSGEELYGKDYFCRSANQIPGTVLSIRYLQCDDESTNPIE